jgi:hypothetical protein
MWRFIVLGRMPTSMAMSGTDPPGTKAARTSIGTLGRGPGSAPQVPALHALRAATGKDSLGARLIIRKPGETVRPIAADPVGRSLASHPGGLRRPGRRPAVGFPPIHEEACRTRSITPYDVPREPPEWCEPDTHTDHREALECQQPTRESQLERLPSPSGSSSASRNLGFNDGSFANLSAPPRAGRIKRQSSYTSTGTGYTSVAGWPVRS